MSDERLIRIEDKIDRLSESTASIDKTIAVQALQLKEHMRRTSLLEETIKPIVNHDAILMAALKLGSMLVGIAAITEAVVILLQYIRK